MLRRSGGAGKLEPGSGTLMIMSFLTAIALGTLLLELPCSTAGGDISFVDALFTSTSAVCVTGLIVKDTGSDFTLFGQIVILVLIQLGGLGIMTFATFFIMILGRRLSFGEIMVFKDSFEDLSARGILLALKRIFVLTIVFEGLGFLLLFLYFRGVCPTGMALYSAAFHSVSAFCNAGFSLYTDSFVGFRASLLVNVTMMGLIVLGGLGFIVYGDVGRYIRSRVMKRDLPALSLHTKLVLSSSVILILAGAVFFFVMECRNAMAGMGWGESITASFFQSITARTAGFNTIEVSSCSNSSIVVLMILMFIGGSPASTAGGIKTTTLAVLVAVFLTRIKGRENVSAFRRKIPLDVISRAATVFFLALVFVIAVTVSLQIVQHTAVPTPETRENFIELLFETVSAFGTVGLTMGGTGELVPAGKVLIIITMFVGRLGPLWLALRVARRFGREERFEFAEENVMIG